MIESMQACGGQLPACRGILSGLDFACRTGGKTPGLGRNHTMSWTRQVIHSSISLLVIAWSLGSVVIEAQQVTNSTRSSTNASRPAAGSWAGMSRANSSGGGSSWTAGKGSFGFSSQPGGIWRDRSASGTTASAASGLAASSATSARSSGSPSARLAGGRGGGSSGTASFAHSSAPKMGGMVSSRSRGGKTLGSKNGAGGLRRGVGSGGRRNGAASFGAAKTTQHSSARESAASSSRIGALGGRESRARPGTLP
jgi:hypothetical protein